MEYVIKFIPGAFASFSVGLIGGIILGMIRIHFCSDKSSNPLDKKEYKKLCEFQKEKYRKWEEEFDRKLEKHQEEKRRNKNEQ